MDANRAESGRTAAAESASCVYALCVERSRPRGIPGGDDAPIDVLQTGALLLKDGAAIRGSAKSECAENARADAALLARVDHLSWRYENGTTFVCFVPPRAELAGSAALYVVRMRGDESRLLAALARPWDDGERADEVRGLASRSACATLAAFEISYDMVARTSSTPAEGHPRRAPDETVGIHFVAEFGVPSAEMRARVGSGVGPYEASARLATRFSFPREALVEQEPLTLSQFLRALDASAVASLYLVCAFRTARATALLDRLPDEALLAAERRCVAGPRSGEGMLTAEMHARGLYSDLEPDRRASAASLFAASAAFRAAALEGLHVGAVLARYGARWPADPATADVCAAIALCGFLEERATRAWVRGVSAESALEVLEVCGALDAAEGRDADGCTRAALALARAALLAMASRRDLESARLLCRGLRLAAAPAGRREDASSNAVAELRARRAADFS